MPRLNETADEVRRWNNTAEDGGRCSRRSCNMCPLDEYVWWESSDDPNTGIWKAAYFPPIGLHPYVDTPLSPFKPDYSGPLRRFIDRQLHERSGPMFKCRVKRQGNLEIYMQSTELEELMRQLHSTNPKYGDKPNQDYHWDIGELYRAETTDGGTTWTRGRRIYAGTTSGGNHLRTATWLGALDRIRTVTGGQFYTAQHGQATLLPSGDLNLWPLLLKDLGTGFVIVNPEPMTVEQIRSFSSKLEAAVTAILNLAKPVDITVSFTKKPAAAPQPPTT